MLISLLYIVTTIQPRSTRPARRASDMMGADRYPLAAVLQSTTAVYVACGAGGLVVALFGAWPALVGDALTLSPRDSDRGAPVSAQRRRVRRPNPILQIAPLQARLRRPRAPHLMCLGGWPVLRDPRSLRALRGQLGRGGRAAC